MSNKKIEGGPRLTCVKNWNSNANKGLHLLLGAILKIDFSNMKTLPVRSCNRLETAKSSGKTCLSARSTSVFGQVGANE